LNSACWKKPAFCRSGKKPTARSASPDSSASAAALRGLAPARSRTCGASCRRRRSTPGRKATSPMSGVRMVKVRSALAGSKPACCRISLLMVSTTPCTAGASSSARGVGSICAPARTNSASSNRVRSRASARAGGRLAQADGLGRAVHAAQAGHGVEDHQQVQVDRADIHGMDSMYPAHRLSDRPRLPSIRARRQDIDERTAPPAVRLRHRRARARGAGELPRLPGRPGAGRLAVDGAGAGLPSQRDDLGQGLPHRVRQVLGHRQAPADLPGMGLACRWSRRCRNCCPTGCSRPTRSSCCATSTTRSPAWWPRAAAARRPGRGAAAGHGPGHRANSNTW
jgi:hypothetical protein